jgi:hypothetical protein
MGKCFGLRVAGNVYSDCLKLRQRQGYCAEKFIFLVL